MKITKKNYIQEVEKIGLEKLPKEMQDAHLYILKMTDDGANWSALESISNFKRIAELAFSKLEEFIANKKGLDGVNDLPYIRQAKEDAKNYQWMETDQLKRIYRMEIDAKNEGDADEQESKIRMTALEKELKKRDVEWLNQIKSDYSLSGKSKKCGVGLFDDDIKDYYPDALYPTNKKKLEKILMFCYDLVAIVKLQRLKIDDYNEFWYEFGYTEGFGTIRDGYIRIEGNLPEDDWYYIPLKPLVCEFEQRFDLKNYEFQMITDPSDGVENPLPAKYSQSKVSWNDREKSEKEFFTAYFTESYFIGKFLSLDKTRLTKKDILSFIKELQKAIVSLQIRKDSPYADSIQQIQNLLVKLYNDEKMPGYFHLKINTSLKSKLKKNLAKAKKDHSTNYNFDPRKTSTVALNGTEKVVEETILPSTEIQEMEFATLGFNGKWLELIGDPCAGFSAMIFGKPKMGKSYLAIDFAGYLAKNFGKVIYVAKEEKFGVTFATKLKDKNAVHENLVVSDNIPEDLSVYDFIFLDSINSLGLKPEDLRKLKEKNPEKSFVFVFQTTKSGNFRGENTFQHDVDIVIEIPERGKAVQFGRFNQGGEMQIFEDAIPQASEELSGTSKKMKYPAWTTPKHLGINDHIALKHFYDLYSNGEYKRAYDFALYNNDTIIREEIPGNIWKEVGGQLTQTGEEKLKIKKSKSVSEKSENKPVKRHVVFDHGVRILKSVFENNYELELTDSQYIEILEIAEDDERFVDLVNGTHKYLEIVLSILDAAYKKWEKQEKLDGSKKSKQNDLKST